MRTNIKSDHVFRAGHLSKENNVSWRGDSGMQDGSNSSTPPVNLVGGYYDAGDHIKFFSLIVYHHYGYLERN